MPELDFSDIRMGVQMALPLGNLNVSTIPHLGYEPRLTSFEPIVEQLHGGVDDIALTLENTETDGDGNAKIRVSDHWNFDHPPEGSEVKIFDYSGSSRELIFWGAVSEIEAVTEGFVTLHVRSMDYKLDKTLGSPVTLDDYPDCPDINVGARKPTIYGAITQFTPLLVDDNVVTKLASSVTVDATTIEVEDASKFATSGSIKINEEVIAYAGTDTASTPNEFTGCTRAQSSTTAGSHVTGDEVHEYANLVFLVADHEVDAITNVKYINSEGILTPADSSLYTVSLGDDDAGTPATITFTETPTTYATGSGSIFKDIDCEAEGAGNTANNPLLCCGRDEVWWTEYNYAEITRGESLSVKRSTGEDILHPNSPIVKAYLVIEHYTAADLDAIDLDVHYYDGSQHLLGQLSATSNTPKEIQEDASVHRESKGFQSDHTHTISNADHGHEINGEWFTPDVEDYYAGTLGQTYKGCDGSIGTAQVMDTVQWIYADYRWVRVQNSGTSIKYVRVNVTHGTGFGATETGGANVYFKIDHASSWNVLGLTAISASGGGQTTFQSSKIDVSGGSWTLNDLTSANTILRLHCTSGSFNVWEAFLEIWYDSESTDVGISEEETPLEASSYTFFDITSVVDDDWDWFYDKLIIVDDDDEMATSDVVYVLRAFYMVEFLNTKAEFTKEIACDVTSSRAATGDGAEILSSIALNELSVPTANLNATSFVTAAASASNGYGGALVQFESGRDVLRRLGEQFRISTHYEDGKLKALFKPDVADIASPSRAISHDDILAGTLTVSRVTLPEIFNLIRVGYGPDYINGGLKGMADPAESATSQTRYGKTGEYEVQGDFIQTEAQADALAEQLLDYLAWSGNIFEMELHRNFIGIQRGDIVAITHRLVTAAKAEVLSIETQFATKDAPTRIRITAIERKTG